MKSNIKALAVLMQHDYGVKERGPSFEYLNIYLPLCDIFGKENVLLFDFFDENKKNGKEAMNKKLYELAASEKPDVSIFCLFENEFYEQTITEIRNYTKTIAYFFDDPWRRDYVTKWRKHFDYFTTSDYYMLKRYELENIQNVIFCPFGFNASIYNKHELPVKYDVSFVGGFSPYRKWIIEKLKKEGIRVNVFGRGWTNKIDWISTEQMVEVFNQSAVNLNLSNGIYWDAGYLLSALKSIKALKHIALNRKKKEQVKGRHFEINACGGFQLSYFVPGLNIFYEIDREIAVYEHINALASEIKFFLKHDALRMEIAQRGYERSHKDHKAQMYLTKLINKVTG